MTFEKSLKTHPRIEFKQLSEVALLDIIELMNHPLVLHPNYWASAN